MATKLTRPNKIKEAKEALAERNKVISDMNTTLRVKYDEMSLRLDEEAARGLRFYHWLGAQVNDVVSDDENVYGTGAMKKISAAWTMNPSMLYKAKAFNDAYSEEALDQLCDLKSDAGTVIGWAHVIQLVGVEEQARPQLQQRVVDEAMTAKELAALVKQLYGQRRTGGRPFMKPKTVRAGLVQLRTVSSQWLNRNTDVWNNKDNSLFQELEDLPPEELTYEMVDELEKIVEDQHSMMDACSQNADSASRLMGQVKSVLQEREQELVLEIREEKNPSRDVPVSRSGPRATGRGATLGKAPRR